MVRQMKILFAVNVLCNLIPYSYGEDERNVKASQFNIPSGKFYISLVDSMLGMVKYMKVKDSSDNNFFLLKEKGGKYDMSGWNWNNEEGDFLFLISSSQGIDTSICMPVLISRDVDKYGVGINAITFRYSWIDLNFSTQNINK